MGKKSKQKYKHNSVDGRSAVSGFEAASNGQKKMPSKEYEAELFGLQVELVKLQEWAKATNARIVIIFEGRDAAGKGGIIKRILERVSPRVFRLVALPSPTERQKTQLHAQRYIEKMPAGGEIVIFDRSWYNRAGVERVMGFCTEEEHADFLRTCPLIERALIRSGIILVKYWLTVDQAEQEQRFEERQDDPLKQWKLSPVDLQARSKYDEYGRARDRMLAATHTKAAPWTLVDFNDQKAGRLKLIANLLSRLPVATATAPEVEIPSLRGKPLKEKFRGPLKPI